MHEIQNLGGCPVKMWLPEGHQFEEEARQQLGRVSRLPFVKGLGCMPDGHVGQGSIIGSVIATEGAIIPAAVGVDIGCGMDYLGLSIFLDQVAKDADGQYQYLFDAIGRAVPHGRTNDGQEGDRGSWGTPPNLVSQVWRNVLSDRFDELVAKHPRLNHKRALNQLGTLGTGNHFIELTVDENRQLGIMLHSGSRGVGNLVGTYFIRLAKQHVKHLVKEKASWNAGVKSGRLPADTPPPPYHPLEDQALAYLFEGTEAFDDYLEGVHWAQDYARENRAIMMIRVLDALRDLAKAGEFPQFDARGLQISCHHNYVNREKHGGQEVWLTRKGAVSAEDGQMGIIPGSMGAKSFLVQGKGHAEAFNSCSHGAGRVMSRTEARNTLTVENLVRDTEGVTCYKDEGVIDEAPKCYKDIEAVMAAQTDMVEVVHTLKQIVCVKGKEKSKRRKKRGRTQEGDPQEGDPQEGNPQEGNPPEKEVRGGGGPLPD
jgi:tRNA-splicing ligase RtcB